MVLAYLSGPIIQSHERRDDFYKLVIRTLAEEDVEVFAPQFLPPASAKEIYERDVHYVRSCDLLIAEVSSPSHGVGMEIMLAIELSKPVLMFHHRNSGSISRMVLGADGKALFTYEDLEEVVEILRGHDLGSLVVTECPSCDSQVATTKKELTKCILCGSTTTGSAR
ncbi:MAG: nucleoside 2-deoxyribosyltransferase [Candidatus Thorarchaeota archaeon]